MDTIPGWEQGECDESKAKNLENDEAEESEEHEDEKIIKEDKESGRSMIPLSTRFGHNGFVDLFDLHHCREWRVWIRSSPRRNCNSYAYGRQRKIQNNHQNERCFGVYYLFILSSLFPSHFCLIVL